MIKPSVACTIVLMLLHSQSAGAETNSTACAPAAEEESAFSLPFPLDFILIFILVAFSALFSGLTLGLLGLDKIGLEIIIAGDNPYLAECARKIAPVRANGNLLLCTLLLGNVAVNALLSILMANMTSGLVGFLVSTFMIVIFGEIIPQATCSRHALLIGSRSLPIVKFFIYSLYILCKPLSMILDKALGEEIGTIHTRTELRKMLEIHVKHQAVDEESGKVMDGALKYRDMKVSEVMTPFSEIFMLSVDEKLNYHVLSKIFKGGYSRIPVFDKDRSDIIGLILAKDLIFIDPEDETPLRNFLSLFGRAAASVWPDQTLGHVLGEFRKSHGHMALVMDVNNTSTTEDPYYELVGIITLEDVMEQILGEEVMDETDFDELDDNGVRLPGMEMDKREREMARLKMLSGKLAEDKLTSEEIQAITSHLTSNVPQIQRLLAGTSVLGTQVVSVAQIRQMVTLGCKVIEFKRKSHPDDILRMEPVSEDILYKRNKPSNVCTLILSGRVVVRAGKDSFRSELGPWSLLGADSLEQEDGEYIPDYTAFVSSDTVRCLLITKANIRKCWLGYDDIAIAPRRKRKLSREAIARVTAPSAAPDLDNDFAADVAKKGGISFSKLKEAVLPKTYGKLSALDDYEVVVKEHDDCHSHSHSHLEDHGGEDTFDIEGGVEMVSPENLSLQLNGRVRSNSFS